MFFPLNSGPCNSFNCLGHFKHVYDDDAAAADDDDDDDKQSRKPDVDSISCKMLIHCS